MWAAQAARGRWNKQGAEGLLIVHKYRGGSQRPAFAALTHGMSTALKAPPRCASNTMRTCKTDGSQAWICAVQAGVVYTWFLQCGCCQWLQTIKRLVVCIAMALVAFETAAQGRPCRPFTYICTVAVLPGSCVIGRVEGQNTRFLKLIAIVMLSMSRFLHTTRFVEFRFRSRENAVQSTLVSSPGKPV